MRNIIGIVAALCMAQSAFADDRDKDKPELRELITCAPGKSFAKLVRKIGEFKPDQIDTLNPDPQFSLTVEDGGAMPERIFIRHQEQDTDLAVAEDGKIIKFLKTFPNDKKAEFCVEDPSRAGTPRDKGAFKFNMSMNVKYRNESGTYAMAELADGLDDGKDVFKKILGGPAALLMPKLTHIMVEFPDEAAEPKFAAYKDGVDVGSIPFESAGDALLIAYESLEALEADELRVTGGAHKLAPSMNKKKLLKYGVIPKEGEESED